MKQSLSQLVSEQEDRPDITPLIDVIFMLLLFFIITTTFAEDTFFPLILPKAERATVRTLDDTTVVEINERGQFAVDKEFVPTQKSLYRYLSGLKDARGIRTVVIKVDKRTDADHLVQVLDVLKGLGLNEFAVTAEKPSM